MHDILFQILTGRVFSSFVANLDFEANTRKQFAVFLPMLPDYITLSILVGSCTIQIYSYLLN
jgi:hypothetical protein